MSGYDSPELRGATSFSGTQHVIFAMHGQPTVRLQRAECSPTAMLADRLARHGMKLDKSAITRTAKDLARIANFPKEPILDHPGWNGPYFALSTGRAIAPPGGPKMIGAVAVPSDSLSVSGMLDEWRDEVATPITGQRVPMFAVMLAFAAPLLDILDWTTSPLIEIVAPGGTGKSLVQLLAASVVGNVRDEPIAFADLLADTDNLLLQHVGGLMQIGEPQRALAGLTPAAIDVKIRDAVVGFSAGPRMTSGRRSALPEHRSICLITSCDSLLDPLAKESAVGKVVAAKLITLRVSERRTLGLFNIVPGGYDGVGQLQATLRTAIERYHGSPLRHYLNRLVAKRATSEVALRDRLTSYIDVFLDKCGIDRSDAEATRIARAFALAYAAGRLAKHYGILPEEWKIGGTVLACYRRHGVAAAVPNLYPARLEEIAAGQDVVVLQKGVEVDPAEVKVGRVFLRHRGHVRVLLIDPEYAEEISLLRKGQKPPPKLAKLMIKEKGHNAPHQRLPGGVRKRLYCFQLGADGA